MHTYIHAHILDLVLVDTTSLIAPSLLIEAFETSFQLSAAIFSLTLGHKAEETS